MQRRRISADIVNPSTSERTLNTVGGCDSLSLSHVADTLNPSSSSLCSSTILDQRYPSRSAGRTGGNVPITNTVPTAPKHVQLASIDLVNKAGLSATLSSGSFSRWENETLGTFDNKVHGERSRPFTLHNVTHMTIHNAATRSASSSSLSSLSRSTSAPSSSADLGASSLLTAPSSCASFHTDQAPSTSPLRLVAAQALPSLNKESVKQYTYVDSLVDAASVITHALWPHAETSVSGQSELDKKVLGHFITETLRKSKTSWSTMQLALLYCIRYRRDQIALARAMMAKAVTKGQPLDSIRSCVGSMCARKNFLSSLILASKFLQDRNFSNRAWSKISTIPIAEINSREREFLEICQWRLDIKHDVFKDWSCVMETFINEIRDNTMFGDSQGCQSKWRVVLLSMITLDDARMHSFMAQLAAADNSSVVTQLLTPAATPGTETPDSYSFATESGAQSCPTSTVHTPISPLAEETEADEHHACPFFDEFIQTSPLQAVDCDAPFLQARPEMAYATPDSLSLNTPDSTLVGVASDGENQAQKLDYDPVLGAATVKDTHLLLTPQSMVSESSDSISAFECICAEAPRGQKRSISAAQVARTDDADMNRSSMKNMMKRQKVGEAFSRYS